MVAAARALASTPRPTHGQPRGPTPVATVFRVSKMSEVELFQSPPRGVWTHGDHVETVKEQFFDAMKDLWVASHLLFSVHVFNRMNPCAGRCGLLIIFPR